MRRFILFVIHIFALPRILYKRYRFNRFTKHGLNFLIGPASNVFVESGSKVTIGDNSEILGVISAKCSSEIRIGNFTTIRGNSLIGCAAGITIGDYVIISNNVHIYDNNNHPTPPIRE